MIKNLERVSVIDTGIRAPEYPRLKAFVSDDVQPTAIMQNFRKRHRMSLTLFVEFDANDAEYRTARDNAKKYMADSLYSEMLSRIQAIQHQVSGGENHMALSMINDLKKDLVSSLYGI